MAIERDEAFRPLELSRPIHSPKDAADREIELE
jgi:hypothetical protein